MSTDESSASNIEHLLPSLLKEYEIVSSRLDKTDERTIQFVGISVTLLTSWAIYVTSQGTNFSMALAWLGPFLFLLIFAYLISIYYFHFNNLWISRILSIRINMILPEPAHITNVPNLPSALFFSSRRGNVKAKAFYALIIGGLISLFILVFCLSFRAIYVNNHLAGTLFVTLYGSVALLEIYSISGLFIDLPNSYKTLLSTIHETGKIPHSFAPNELIQSSFSKFLWSIFPRPADVIAKGHIFWIGFLMAFFTVGITNDRLPLLNLLFSKQNEWKNILDVPVWAIFVLGVLFFWVEEILLQQAKLLWDDVRDVERDKLLLQNRARAIASGRVSIRDGIINLCIRWTLAMVLSAVIGGTTLFLIFLAITLHQALYVLWAKPKAGKYPFLLLIVISFNVALRFIAGATAASGDKWLIMPLILTAAMFFFYSFGGMSALWKIESEYQEKTGKSVAIRPQSVYFLRKGYGWQHVGLLGAIILSAILIFVHKSVVSCQSNVILSYIYGTCNFPFGDLDYITYTPHVATTAVFLLILTNIAICFPLSLISRIAFSALKKPYRKMKGLIVTASVSLCLYYLYHLIVNPSEINLYWELLWLNITLFLNYEQLTYPEYTFEITAMKIKLLFIAIYQIMFYPASSKNIVNVIKEITAIDPEKILFTD